MLMTQVLFTSRYKVEAIILNTHVVQISFLYPMDLVHRWTSAVGYALILGVASVYEMREAIYISL